MPALPALPAPGLPPVELQAAARSAAAAHVCQEEKAMVDATAKAAGGSR